MSVDRMSGTENYRADQTIKNAGNVAAAVDEIPF